MARALGELPIDLPQTNSLSSSTFDPWPAWTGGLSGFSASSAFKTNGNGS